MKSWQTTLSHLIAEAEEQRVEQLLYITTLLTVDEDATEAEEGLCQIEHLIMRMRATQPLSRHRGVGFL